MTGEIISNFTNSFNGNLSDGMAGIGFTQDQLVVLRTTSQVISVFSLVGLLFVQIVFWFFKNIRTFAFELVAWLCFSCCIFNLTNVLPVYESDDLSSMANHNLSTSCTLQSFLNIFSDLSTMIWTMIIGFTAYISVTNQPHLEQNKTKYRIYFIIFAYTLPLSFALM